MLEQVFCFLPVESYILDGDASCQPSVVHENAFVEFFLPGNVCFFLKQFPTFNLLVLILTFFKISFS